MTKIHLCPLSSKTSYFYLWCWNFALVGLVWADVQYCLDVRGRSVVPGAGIGHAVVVDGFGIVPDVVVELLPGVQHGTLVGVDDCEAFGGFGCDNLMSAESFLTAHHPSYTSRFSLGERSYIRNMNSLARNLRPVGPGHRFSGQTNRTGLHELMCNR